MGQTVVQGEPDVREALPRVIVYSHLTVIGSLHSHSLSRLQLSPLVFQVPFQRFDFKSFLERCRLSSTTILDTLLYIPIVIWYLISKW